MKSRRSLRSFAAGLAVGLLIGSVGMAGAALKAKGWHRFSQDFRMGYLHGFFDMAEVARKAQPGGMIEKSYPYFPKVLMLDWYAEVDKFFADPENAESSTYRAIATAAKEIEKKHGPPMSVIQREAKSVAARIQAAREAQDAYRAKREAEKAGDAPAANGKPGSADAGAKPSEERDLSGYWDPKEDPFKRKRRNRDCCPCPAKPAAEPAAETAPAQPATAPPADTPSK